MRDEQFGDVPLKGDETRAVEQKIVTTAVTDKRLLVTEGEFSQALQVARREGNTPSAILRLA